MGGVAGTAAASADAAARCLREDPMWLPHPCVPQNHHVHALLYMHGDIAFYIKCHIAAYDISIYIYIHTMVSLYSRYMHTMRSFRACCSG